MARYESHPTDENKYQSTFDEYGHGEGNGKSRQSINRHFNKLELIDQTPPKPDEEKIETVEVDDVDNTESKPEYDWLNVDFDEVGDSPLKSLPSPSRTILQAFADSKPPITKAEKELYYKKQAKLMRFLASGIGDPLLNMYVRGVMGEKGKDFAIQRTEDDWKLFESISESWCEHRQITIPVSPDMLMIGCVGTFYVPPVIKAYRNRDPSRKSIFTKLKNRVVTWRARRRLKKLGVEEYE